MIRRLLAASALLAIGAACSGTGLLGEASGTLASLPPTDRMRVQVVEHGEWGDRAFELEIRRDGEARVKAVRLKGKWSDTAREFVVRTRGTPVEGRLSSADLADLDAVLRYYRSDPPASCDETRFVTLTRLREGRPIDTEQLVDRSCGAGIERLTSFADVVERMAVPAAR